jgi:putative ABC transport system substrate-binding protein
MAISIGRRQFVFALGSAAAAWPFVARAQQPGMPVIGFNSGAIGGYRNLLIAFRRGLADLGFVDGQNVTIEYRWAEGRFDRLPELATDLLQHGVSVIVTGGIGSALGARKASATIPLVFLAGDDPMKYGLVATLNRPGGAATGIAWLTSELFTKRLEIMRELVPTATLIGVLINPKSPEVEPQVKEIETAAQTLRQPLHTVNASTEPDFDTAFATLAERGAGALIVSNDAFFNGMRERIIALAAQHRIPAIYDRREYTAAGGLISYGTSYAAAYRELGVYAGKILKGTKPADLPIEQATKFEMVINLLTAKALSLEVPAKLIALADEVIE